MTIQSLMPQPFSDNINIKVLCEKENIWKLWQTREMNTNVKLYNLVTKFTTQEKLKQSIQVSFEICEFYE